MTKFRKIIYCAILTYALFAFGCTEEVDVIETIPETQLEVNPDDPLIREILNRGFAFEHIEAFENFYLVEGDISFPKDYLDGVAVQNIDGKQRRDIDIVVCEFRCIDVFLNDQSFNILNRSVLNSALDNVINAYNALDIAIKFEQVFNGNSADIVIGTGSVNGAPLDTPQGCAFADPPTMGENSRPGAVVTLIEQNLMDEMVTSRDKLAQVLAHELGHTIGLRHTDDPNGIGSLLIPNTPTLDSESFMNSDTCGETFVNENDFSAGDNLALNLLYPKAENCNNCINDDGGDVIVPLNITFPFKRTPLLSVTGQNWELTWDKGSNPSNFVTLNIFVNNVVVSSEQIPNSGRVIRSTSSGTVHAYILDINNSREPRLMRDDVFFNFTNELEEISGGFF